MSENGLTRRKFLSGGLAAAAGAAAAPVVLPQAAHAADEAGMLTTVLDLSKCVGCESCVEACRDQWQETVPDPVSPFPQPFPARVPIEDWSKHKDVQDRLTPYNFLYIEKLFFDYKGEERELNVPRRCMHCINPPCTNLCPFGAGRVEENGIAHIDPEVCLGGNKCKQVCPWHIPQRQSGTGLYLNLLPTLAGNGTMFKCHRCLPLVKKGEQPRCVTECPYDVQSIGLRPEMMAKAEELARKMAKEDSGDPERWRDYVYGIEENGGTNTVYVSPIPFAVVSKAMDKHHKENEAENIAQAKQGIAKKIGAGQGRGQGRGAGRGRGVPAKRPAVLSNLGRPHMHPVANSMSNEENLGKAILLAPVAGLAAGFLKLFSKAISSGDRPNDQGTKGGQS
jgi:Fe-S-cluster-containing dehydrogenase component